MQLMVMKPSFSSEFYNPRLQAVPMAKRRVPEEEWSPIWRKLVRLFEAQGLSQSEFGRRIGVSGTAMIFWRTGKNYPTPEVRQKISEVLGVPESEFASPEEIERAQRLAGVSGESRIVREEAYPSFQDFIDGGHGADLTPEELAEVRSERGNTGDPGLGYYMHRADAIRARKRFQAARNAPTAPANLADASRQPGGIPLKRKPAKR